MTITARTRVFALLGQPVAHSLSPRIQNAAFRAAGIDAVYVAMACTTTELPAIAHALIRSGGGGNVTVPHKTVAATIGSPDARVSALGAANVFGADQTGAPVVRNTDVDGITALVAGLAIAAPVWGILGTGGSARAAAGAAKEAGVSIAVRSRDSERGRRFGEWAGTLGLAVVPFEAATLLINATPLGLLPDDALPIELAQWPGISAVLDLTYRHDGPTELVRLALAHGLPTAGGREMLIVQGAAAWQTWLPGITPPMEVMRAALAGRMG